MILIDFIDQAIKEIGKKQSEAFEEFGDGILNLQVGKIENQQSAESEVANNLQPAQYENQQNKDDLDLDSEQEIQRQQKGFVFFEKIEIKNSRVLDNFFPKLNQIKVQNDPMLPKNKKQTPKLSQKIEITASHYDISLNRKDKISSLSQQYHKTIEVNDAQKNNFTPYKKSLELYQRTDLNQNPQKEGTEDQQKQKTASEILAELEQIHKQRSIEKLSNGISTSIKKRTRIIKMSSEMQDKLKVKKQKQAEQRIKINIEFLESIKMKDSKETPSFKEFNNSAKQETEKLKQSIRIKKIKKTTLLSINEYSDQPMTEERQSQLSSSLKTSLKNSNIFMESPLKLPQISERKGALKPKPYSVYNVTQRGNEMFFNFANR